MYYLSAFIGDSWSESRVKSIISALSDCILKINKIIRVIHSLPIYISKARHVQNYMNEYCALSMPSWLLTEANTHTHTHTQKHTHNGWWGPCTNTWMTVFVCVNTSLQQACCTESTHLPIAAKGGSHQSTIHTHNLPSTSGCGQRRLLTIIVPNCNITWKTK